MATNGGNIVQHFTKEYTKENKTSYWPSRTTMKTTDLLHHKQFTFKVETILLAVYDNNDDDITQKYQQKDENKEPLNDGDNSVQQTILESIVSRIDELTLKFDNMQQKINDIE